MVSIRHFVSLRRFGVTGGSLGSKGNHFLGKQKKRKHARKVKVQGSSAVLAPLEQHLGAASHLVLGYILVIASRKCLAEPERSCLVAWRICAIAELEVGFFLGDNSEEFLVLLGPLVFLGIRGESLAFLWIPSGIISILLASFWGSAGGF